MNNRPSSKLAKNLFSFFFSEVTGNQSVHSNQCSEEKHSRFEDSDFVDHDFVVQNQPTLEEIYVMVKKEVDRITGKSNGPLNLDLLDELDSDCGKKHQNQFFEEKKKEFEEETNSQLRNEKIRVKGISMPNIESAIGIALNEIENESYANNFVSFNQSNKNVYPYTPTQLIFNMKSKHLLRENVELFAEDIFQNACEVMRERGAIQLRVGDIKIALKMNRPDRRFDESRF